eukprot:GFUD01052832.1.p1 GENE.GFUD01052832.1~~GFUD01052832.1.p1  ORF type:complete len:591 (+),score=173.42 GFUD01052832.1:70-1842(+)
MYGILSLTIVSFLLPDLTYSGKIYQEYQNDYPTNYEYYEAEYDDVSENQFDEENNEKESNRTLTFISTPKTFVVYEGDAIKLPCNVDNLENLLIIWKRGNRIITLGEKPYEDDDSRVQVEKTVNGNTLVIRLSEEKDAGEYVCQVSSAKPVELKHTVKIIVRPEVESVPKSGLLGVKAGESAELLCKVTRGSPEPDVMWRRKERPMPSGENTLSGLSIIFPETNRHHSGLYTCYADNGWKMPSAATIRLDVQHEPEIEQEMMTVRNKEETEIQITCKVHASPLATVEWYRDGHLLEIKDNVITKRGNRHTLLLTGIKKKDRRGKYECRARNDMGELSAVIDITDEDSDAATKLEEHVHNEDSQHKMKVHLDQESGKKHEKADDIHLNNNEMEESSVVIDATDEDSDLAIIVDQEDGKVHEKADNIHSNNNEIEESSAVKDATEEDSNVAIKIEEHDRTGDIQSKPKIHVDKEIVKIDNKSENVRLNAQATDDAVNSLFSKDLDDLSHDAHSEVANNRSDHVSDPIAESASAETHVSDSDESVPNIFKIETKKESQEVSKPEKLRDTSSSISNAGDLYLCLAFSVIYMVGF